MNENTQIARKPKFSVAITTPSYQKLINNTLKDPRRAADFVAAVTSAVSANPALQDCDPGSVLSAALLGESLKLSPSPQLGHYYMVPYKEAVRDVNGKIMYNNGKKVTESKAQFQMGYKGYIQLAIRSGQYKKLNVLPVKEGELINYDPVDETIRLAIIEDEEKRENAETIGYFAMFEYLNGFRKALYWSKSKMEHHADKYSKAFSLDSYRKIQNGEISDNDMWKYSSFWYKDFDMMAQKTMLRQLIGKWGIMSVDFQRSYERDMAVIDDDGGYTYPDTDSAPLPIPAQSGPLPSEPADRAPNDANGDMPFPEMEPEELSFDDL